MIIWSECSPLAVNDVAIFASLDGGSLAGSSFLMMSLARRDMAAAWKAAWLDHKQLMIKMPKPKHPNTNTWSGTHLNAARCRDSFCHTQDSVIPVKSHLHSVQGMNCCIRKRYGPTLQLRWVDQQEIDPGRRQAGKCKLSSQLPKVLDAPGIVIVMRFQVVCHLQQNLLALIVQVHCNSWTGRVWNGLVHYLLLIMYVILKPKTKFVWSH